MVPGDQGSESGMMTFVVLSILTVRMIPFVFMNDSHDELTVVNL